jgi:hypothetical protein
MTISLHGPRASAARSLMCIEKFKIDRFNPSSLDKAAGIRANASGLQIAISRPISTTASRGSLK